MTLLQLDCLGQKQSKQNNSLAIGLEIGGFAYSNGEIGAYPGFHFNWKGQRSLVMSPIFITNKEIVRFGGMLCFRGTLCSNCKTDVVKALGELGMQYFEIKNDRDQFQKTFLLTYGLGMYMKFGKYDALISHIGIGWDIGGIFRGEEPGFTGILRMSWLFSDLYKLKR